MSSKITVLIVDDLLETRQNLHKLLQFEADIEVVGLASSGQEAVKVIKQLQPNVVLMDINMPDVDGIAATKTITQTAISTQIIIMSVQSEPDYLRRAMLAGARDFLMKPFSGEELSSAIRIVHETRPTATNTLPKTSQPPLYPPAAAPHKGQIVAVFSPKGGSGCTTVAVNVAVQLALRGQRTLLIDGRFQFGDVAVMLNLKATTTILDLLDRVNELDYDLLNGVALTHSSGLKVLLAPPRPEMAELVMASRLEPLLENVRGSFDYIIVDAGSVLFDPTLTILDRADLVLLVAQQSLPCLKNISLFYDLAKSLGYIQGKIWLVVNRFMSKQGISVKDIAEALKNPVVATIPADEPTAVLAADRGYPMVYGATQKRPIAVSLMELAGRVMVELAPKVAGQIDAGTNPATRFGRLFTSR